MGESVLRFPEEMESELALKGLGLMIRARHFWLVTVQKEITSSKHHREITYSTGGALNAGKDSDEARETDFLGDLGFFLEGIAGGSDFRLAAFAFD